MIQWIKNWFMNINVDIRLESMEKDITQLRTDIKLFETEVMEEFLTRTDKLSKRIAIRSKREEDLTPPVPVQPTGMRIYGGKSLALMGRGK